MPKIVTTTVFTIDELSDAAREKARSWYRDQGLFDEWNDYVFQDFETICRIIGITLDTHPVRLSRWSAGIPGSLGNGRRLLN